MVVNVSGVRDEKSLWHSGYAMYCIAEDAFGIPLAAFGTGAAAAAARPDSDGRIKLPTLWVASVHFALVCIV